MISYLKKNVISLIIASIIGVPMSVCAIEQQTGLTTYNAQKEATHTEIVTMEEPSTEPVEPMFVPNSKVDCPEDIQQVIWEVSKEYHISFEFMLALIETESDFQTDCISDTDDYGICQINQCRLDTLSEQYGIMDIMDVRQNVTASCIILSGLFEKYEDMNLVLMAYNMGESGARRHWNQGTYESRYSIKIMNRKEEIENDN